MSKSHYQAGIFIPFRDSLSGGIKWENKTEKYREYARKNAFNLAMSSAQSLTNEEVAKEFGRNGKKKVLSKYTWNIIADKWKTVFEEVVK